MSRAEHGCGANLRLADFTTARTVLATHHQGETFTAEHGLPLHLVVPHLCGYKGPKSLRGIEYLAEDGRGFWEELGCHNIAGPCQEQRYSYQSTGHPCHRDRARGDADSEEPVTCSPRDIRTSAASEGTGIAPCRVQGQQPRDRTGTAADDLLTCTPIKWL